MKKLREIMKAEDLDSIILIGENNKDIFYYTGYLGYGILIVRKRSHHLLVPEMELEKAKKCDKNAKAIGKGERDSKISKYAEGKKFGFDGSISYKEYRRLKKITKGRYKDISHELRKKRAVKEESEITCIKKACKITDEIFSLLLNNFNFKTEKEIEKFIDIEIRKRGCEPSFTPLVGSGKNSSIVHHTNTGKIKKGFLLLDFGVYYKGYASDMSRTVYLGKPSENEILEYERVLSLQEELISLCKEGVIAGELDKKARTQLKEKFLHGLGHGVGLEVHELPNLLPDSKDVLRKNHVVTIEPGVYYEGKYGIRIEDTVLVGSKTLTKSPKELIVINLQKI